MDAVIGVVIAIALFAIPIIIGAVRQKKVKKCKQCKKKFNYDEEVSWKVVQQSYSSNGHKLYADVEITCTCSNCGSSKTYKRSFTVAEIDQNGNAKDYNLDNLVRKYFK